MSINKILFVLLILFILFIFKSKEQLSAFSFDQSEEVSCNPQITSSCYTPVPSIDYTTFENVNYSFSRLANSVSVNGVPNLVLHLDKNVVNNFEIYLPVSGNSKEFPETPGDELYIFNDDHSFFLKLKNGYYQILFEKCLSNTLYYQSKNGLNGGVIHLHNLF